MTSPDTETCSVLWTADPEVAGMGIRYSVLAGSLVLVVGWAAVPPERSFKKVVRQVFLSGLFLNGTALIQIFRHRLRYYHLAVVEQLVILSIVPLGCALLRPGWHTFRLFEKSVVVSSALFAMGWPTYLELLRPNIKSLEVECRKIWLREIQLRGPQVSGRVLRTLNLESDEVQAFYVYEYFVNALGITLSTVGLVFLAISFRWAHHQHRSLLDDKFVLRCWLLLGFGTSVAHQYKIVKHFRNYTDDSDNNWGFGQIYPLLAILLPIGDFATDITYEEFCQALPFRLRISIEDMVRGAIAGLAGMLTFITLIKRLPAVFEALEDFVNVTPDNLDSVATILWVALVISPGICLFALAAVLGAIVAGGFGYVFGTHLVTCCRCLFGAWRSAAGRGLIHGNLI